MHRVVNEVVNRLPQSEHRLLGQDLKAAHQARKDLKWLRTAAFAAGQFSTCAKRQYLAIVLDSDGFILGMGYNGSPPGMGHCSDGACPRLAENSPGGSSYENCIAVHAEANALLHTDWTARKGGTLVVNGPPCWDCGKLISNSGIRRVVHLTDDSYSNWPKVAEFMYTSGISIVGYNPSLLEEG